MTISALSVTPQTLVSYGGIFESEKEDSTGSKARGGLFSESWF